MPAPTDTEVQAAPRRAAPTESKPLLGIATEDLFRKNSFRVTGLPVDATPREISKHIDKLKQMTELGLAGEARSGPLALDPPPTSDDIREAHQNLKDPERRILDEFFWFWPQDFGSSQTDPSIQALAAGDCDTALAIWRAKETSPSDGVVAMHNIAVFWHVKALDAETKPGFKPLAHDSRKQLETLWRDAIKRWGYLATDDALWDKVAGRVRQLSEARLTTGFIRRMRATLTIALRKVHAERALHYSQSPATDLAQMHIGFMRAEGKDPAAADRAAELTLAPTITRVREHIRSAKQAADASPNTADHPARDLIDLGLPLRATFDLFYGPSPHPAKDLLDEIASTSTYCLVAHQRSTGDNRTFFELLERALPLAGTPEVRRRLQDNINIGKNNWAWATLKAIQESTDAPRQKLLRFRRDAEPVIAAITHLSGVSTSFGPLSADPDTPKELLDTAAIVLRNISLDAWNKYRDQPTALQANELAFQYATKPDFRERLTDDRLAMGHTSSTADEPRTHRTPPRYASPPHQQSNLDILKQHKGFVIAAAIVALIVLANVKSCDTPSASVTATAPLPAVQPTYTPPPPPAQPVADPQSPFSQAINPQKQFAPRIPASSGQQTYRVSPSLRGDLDRDKQAIDLEKAKAARLEALLEQSQTEVDAKKAEVEELDTSLDALGRRIELDRTYLDRTSQYEIDDFNLKVARYNTALRNRKAEVEAFNQMVGAHNTLVEQLRAENRLVNQMVDTYNAKLQPYRR